MSEQIEQQGELETIQEVEVVVETEPEQERESENKEHYEDESPDVVVVEQPVSGPTSWDELDAKQAAMEQAASMQQVTHQFQMMVQNVLASDMPNKGAAIEALSSGLSARLNETKEREDTAADTLTKEQHYKEVAHDDKLAVESDFQGGCLTCHFGEPSIMKELSNCPYCWNVLEVNENA